MKILTKKFDKDISERLKSLMKSYDSDVCFNIPTAIHFGVDHETLERSIDVYFDDGNGNGDLIFILKIEI
jgi:hypothetical protein